MTQILAQSIQIYYRKIKEAIIGKKVHSYYGGIKALEAIYNKYLGCLMKWYKGKS